MIDDFSPQPFPIYSEDVPYSWCWVLSAPGYASERFLPLVIFSRLRIGRLISVDAAMWAGLPPSLGYLTKKDAITDYNNAISEIISHD